MTTSPKANSPAQPNSTVTRPPTFEDSAKRSWSIKLTLGLIDRVLAQTELDLAPDDADASFLIGLCHKHKLLGSVLWACVEPQATERGVKREEFVDELDGPDLYNGWVALVEATFFFIRSTSPSVAAAMEETFNKGMELQEAGAKEMVARLRSTATTEAMREAARKAGEKLEAAMREELGAP